VTSQETDRREDEKGANVVVTFRPVEQRDQSLEVRIGNLCQESRNS
jgi:hypothetical protein